MENMKSKYVKKQTMLVVAFAALAAGFLGGIIFSAYKTGSEPGLSAQAPGKGMQNPEISNEQASSIISLEKDVSLLPLNVEAWVQLGNLYFDTNQVKKAIGAYEKSLEIDPKNPSVLADLGVMYRRNGQPLEAVKAFDRAMQADPKHEVSRFNKGIVLLHDLKEPEKAIKAWEELLEVNPLAATPNGELVMEMIQGLKKKTSP